MKTVNRAPQEKVIQIADGCLTGRYDKTSASTVGALAASLLFNLNFNSPVRLQALNQRAVTAAVA